MTRSFKAILLLTAILLAAGTATAADANPGVRLKIIPEYTVVDAGDTLRVGAVVNNFTRTDHFVILKAHLAPVAKSIPIPPATVWERFVWQLLAEISGDTEVIFVPAGQVRAARLSVDVHPRMHGRFEVVGTARTQLGRVTARASVLSKITAPPSNGGVLVHGRLFELGSCRILLTDDGHVYEPKGPQANLMFRLLDYIYPRPDGVTILGSILPNTVGCIGVELGVDIFRFHKNPGSPVGVRYRTIARGRTHNKFGGPDEMIVRDMTTLKRVFVALGASLIGERPSFPREMVAVVTTAGNQFTRIRVGRIYLKNGVMYVNYTVTKPGAGCRGPFVFAQPYHLVALPNYRGPIKFVRRTITVPCDRPTVGSLQVDRPLELSKAKQMVAAQEAKKLQLQAK